MALLPSDYLEHTSASIDFINEHLVPTTSFSTSVPTCPGWSVRDLFTHIGSVAAMVTTIVSARSTTYLATPASIRLPPQRSSDEALCQWVEHSLTTLVHELKAISPTQPLWTWGEPSAAEFYFRRMCMEMTVHAYDLACSFGTVWSTPTFIAADGISEYLDVILPKVIGDIAGARRPGTLPTSDLHIHCLDADGEWYSRIENGIIRTVTEHRKAAVAWRGPTCDLLRWVWGRHSSTIECLGEPDQSNVWQALSP